jgi:hypothetical protein
MKLNIQSLFSSSKKPKYSQKKLVKFTPSSFNTKEKTVESTSVKKREPNKKDNTQTPKVNPFIENFIRKNNHHKTWIHKKTQSSKIEKNYFKDILLTSEFDSNLNNENEIETLCKMFQSSKLKSTIIMDNNGNSNLNNEEKKFIEDYLDKKEKLENKIKKCKINSIKVQNYNHNDILLKQKTSSNKAINFKFMKNDFLTIDNNNKRKISNKPILYNKQKNKISDFFKFNGKSEDENEKADNDKENNSMFENCTNKSFDSSFLGSSLAEDFLLPFNDVIVKD